MTTENKNTSPDGSHSGLSYLQKSILHKKGIDKVFNEHYNIWHKEVKQMKSGIDTRGLTQKEISEATGIPIDTIKGWMSGRRTPPMWQLKLVNEKIKELSPEYHKRQKFKELQEKYPQYQFYINDNFRAVTFNYISAVYNGSSIAICDYHNLDWEDRIQDFFDAVKSYEEKDNFFEEVNKAFDDCCDIKMDNIHKQRILYFIIYNEKQLEWEKEMNLDGQ